MKIKCALTTCVHPVALLWFSSWTLGASASMAQVHGFMATKGQGGELQPGLGEKLDSDELKSSTVFWSEKSAIPFDLTLLVAGVWVLTIGSAPILIHQMGEKKVTKSWVTVSVLMWLGLFGGLYSFTNMILFNSPHFDSVRSLTIIECCYFMTQVITTVGYGDITPAYPRGQVFVGIYVLFSFFVITLLISQMQALVMERVGKYKDKIRQRVTTTTGYGLSHSQSSSDALIFKPEKPEVTELLTALGLFAMIAFVWAAFFHFYPGEEKLWFEACYMALITLSTVGFGAVTPVTEGGMLFGAFFMFIGTSALLNVVTALSTFILEMDQWETWTPQKFQTDLKKFGGSLKIVTGHHDISESKFLQFALVQKSIVTQEQIDAITDSYASMATLDEPGEGRLLSPTTLDFHKSIGFISADPTTEPNDGEADLAPSPRSAHARRFGEL